MIRAHVRTVFKSGNDMEYRSDMIARMCRAKRPTKHSGVHICTSRLGTEAGNKSPSVFPFMLQCQEVATYFPFMAVFRLIQGLEDTKYCTAYSPAGLRFCSRHKERNFSSHQNISNDSETHAAF
jgi:hypothetical protein